MIVDSSSVLAILLQEPEARRIAHALAPPGTRRISAANVLEIELVAAGRTGGAGSADIDRMLRHFAIDVVPVSLAQLEIARRAVRSFGRGHHPARLNFGDCFAYALAVERGEPLLFIGAGFSQTDIGVVSF